MGIIKKYFNLGFKKKTEYSTILSIALNICSGIFQFVLGIVIKEYFLCVSGFVSFFLLSSKLNCILGINLENKSFQKRNQSVSILLMLSGVCYIAYMSRLLVFDIHIKQYPLVLAIMIAAISFGQIGVAIYGLFKVKGQGHLYKNIKVINLTSSLTSLVLTQTALMSMSTSQSDLNTSVGYFGIGVGIFSIILGIFVWISPRFSLDGKEHQIYRSSPKEVSKEINIVLLHDKIMGNYYYQGEIKEDLCDGYIKKERICFFRMNLFFKILVCILSELLIFVLAIDGIIYYFRSFRLLKILEQKMKDMGYQKCN